MKIEHMFKYAQFGDKFKTRNGEMVIFINKTSYGGVVVRPDGCIQSCLEDGKEENEPFHETVHDVVGVWTQKKLSDEELDKLAEEQVHEKYYYTNDVKGAEDFMTGWKACYRKLTD